MYWVVLQISSLFIATAQNERCCSLLIRRKQLSSREKGQGHTPQQGEGSRSHTTAGGRVKVSRHSRGRGGMVTVRLLPPLQQREGSGSHHSRGKGRGHTPQQGEGSRSRHSKWKSRGHAPQQGEGSGSSHSEGAETDTPPVLTNTVTMPRLTLLQLLPSPTSLCLLHNREVNPSKEVLRQGT